MGEHLVKKITDSFKHAQDLAFERFEAPDLFNSQPEVFMRTYECELLVPGFTFTGSEQLLVCIAGDGTVQAWLANLIVGYVTGADKEALATALRNEPNARGMLLAEVVEQSSEFGDFSIRCVEDPDDE